MHENYILCFIYLIVLFDIFINIMSTLDNIKLISRNFYPKTLIIINNIKINKLD